MRTGRASSAVRAPRLSRAAAALLIAAVGTLPAAPAAATESAVPGSGVRIPLLEVATTENSGGRIVVDGHADPGRLVGRVRAEARDVDTGQIWSGSARPRRDGYWVIVIVAEPGSFVHGAELAVITAHPRGRTSTYQVEVPAAPAPDSPEVAVEVDPDAAPSGDPASYRFTATGSNGQPAHWDHCAVVRYYVNTHAMPEGALDTIHEAFARFSAAAGQRFEYGGETGSTPYLGSSGDVPAEKGDGVYVGFATEEEAAALAGDVVGLGGFHMIDPRNGADTRIVRGGVLLQADAGMATGFTSGTGLGGVLLHELGHVFNLAHVDDPSQLMHPSRRIGAPTTPQAGDRAGLGGLASRGCF